MSIWIEQSIEQIKKVIDKIFDDMNLILENILKIENRLDKLERNSKSRDLNGDKSRRCAQILIDEIGATGPEDLEENITRAVDIIKKLKLENETHPNFYSR